MRMPLCTTHCGRGSNLTRATLIDDNAADGKSGKSYGWLLISIKSQKSRAKIV